MKISISGVRGIFGNDFTLKDVLRFCNNFSILVKSKKCVIARDTRPSGIMIQETASAALMQCGIDIYNLGMSPTPVAFRESRKYGAGVIISSSHNPLEWNGLKFIVDGRGINEAELDFIVNDQTTQKTKFGNENSIVSDYVQEAVNVIGTVEKPPKAIIDVGGGAARTVAPKLLESIGCKVITINENLDNSTRGPDPTTNELKDLVSQTKNESVGFAFDLDGDRLVVVFDGKKQSPDVTLGLGVARALDIGYKKFALSTDSSISIEKYILSRGGTVSRSKVGEANVIDLMLKTNSQAGGEGSSGGFILPEFNYCRDGLLTSGLIASMINTDGFKEMLDFMKDYQQKRTIVKMESSLHGKILERLYEKMKLEYSEISLIDGIKAVIDENSWILVRKSNTEDIIRISAESNNLDKVESLIKKTREQIEQSYEQVK